MVKRYAGLYCNDIENRIKSLLITNRMEQAIVGHVSRNSDTWQCVGVDMKRVEFNLLRGVKGIKSVALDIETAAATADQFQQIMMSRFKFMEQSSVNNIYDIKDKEVDYYTYNGKDYQFDEIFELTVDLTEDDKNFKKLKLVYPELRIPKILTIEQIYNDLQEEKWSNPQMPVVKGYKSYVDKNSITKTRGTFKPKILLLLCDELNELMTNDDYRSVDTVKGALGSIARLGRAAAVHLALACQRPSGNTISGDLKNNIGMSVLLGGFDSSASTLLFDKDISNMCKPDIKGRCFIQSGNEIIEAQSYYTQPVNDWEFDEDQLLTYTNPIYIEQCEKNNKKLDTSGFIEGQFSNNSNALEEDLKKDEELEEDESEEFEEDISDRLAKYVVSEEDVKDEKEEQELKTDSFLGDSKIEEKPKLNFNLLDKTNSSEDLTSQPKLKLNINLKK